MAPGRKRNKSLLKSEKRVADKSTTSLSDDIERESLALRDRDEVWAEGVTNDPISSKDLWGLAYRVLKHREPDLAEAYERVIASHVTNSTSGPITINPDFIQDFVTSQIKFREASQWVWTLRERTIKVREQCEKIIKFIIWSKDLVSSALTAQPYAALAWSGVTLLLPLFLNSSQQSASMLEGLNSITDLMRLYKIREKIYLEAGEIPAKQFAEAVTRLYADIFEFQARLICYLSKRSVKRGIRGTLKLDDWEGMLKKIQTSDGLCAQHMEILAKHSKRSTEEKHFQMQTAQMLNSITIQQEIASLLKHSELSRQRDHQSDKEAKLLEMLASNYKSDKDRIRIRVEGTCEWFFQDQRFCDWREGRGPSLLWVSAGPGCGKSVLARSLVDDFRVSDSIFTTIVCYFFFKDGQLDRTHATDALSALLHQLLEKVGASEQALSSYHKYGDKLRDESSELWKILIDSAHGSGAREVVCVIDALDECEETDRQQLMDNLACFTSHPTAQDSHSPKLRFLITSRPYDDLAEDFRCILEDGSCIRLDGNDKAEIISQEINLFIDAKIPSITKAFSDEDRNRISARLKQMEHRTYLWLYLTLEIIKKSRSKYGKPSDLEHLLSNLPLEVTDAYEKILDRSSDPKRARVLLQLILAARKPLCLEEANVALTLATQRSRCNSHKELELWPLEDFSATVQNMCGLFVNVHGGKLFLIHQTAREYLIGDAVLEPSPDKWEKFTDVARNHSTMTRVCLDYLSLEPFVTIRQSSTPVPFDEVLGLEGPMDQLQVREWQDIPVRSRQQKLENMNFPFLNYAAGNWIFHYDQQNDEQLRMSTMSARALCDVSLHRFGDFSFSRPWVRDWFDIYRRNHYTNGNGVKGLGLATFLGLGKVVELYLDEGTDPNISYDHYGTALEIASDQDDSEIAALLIKHGAEVNAHISDCNHSLYRACTRGHVDVVKLLLDAGAFANTDDAENKSALAIAIANQAGKGKNTKYTKRSMPYLYSSHKNAFQIVKLLLEKGANVNGRFDEMSALHLASLQEEAEIVKLLLDYNADLSAHCEKVGYALHAACYRGNLHIAELLLDAGADINAEGGPLGYPLIAAVSAEVDSARACELVRLLLSRGAKVNVNCHESGTALQMACHKSRLDITRLLLDKGADVNAEGGKYGRPLYAACKYRKAEKLEERLQITKLLLDHGGNVNVEGGDFGTALQLAAHCSRGETKIVELLLDRGADVNIQSGQFGSALQAAAASEYEGIETIELLLHRGADVNAQCGYGNPLKAAICCSGVNPKKVKILLDWGANVNAKFGKPYGTALIAAAFSKHADTEVLDMLLRNGADVNAQGGTLGLGNALQAAAFSTEGNLKKVQLLLDWGANGNAVGGEFGTALIAAAWSDYKGTDVLDILLRNGADIHAQEGHYGNALQAAASVSERNLRKVKLLLDWGANVNAIGGRDGTALIAAASSIYRGTEVLDLLLRNGADINAQGGTCRNALQAAAASPFKGIESLELLLSWGADINDQGGWHGNALQAAAVSSEGSLYKVKLLLDWGADVNAIGGWSGTALIAAASSEYEGTEVLDLLLRNGADVNVQWGRYGNARQAALYWRREKKLDLLIERGAEWGSSEGVLSKNSFEEFIRQISSWRAQVRLRQ
ncbi:hypothetical protein ACLMJK_007693 [Lecanora helva]